MWYNQIGNIIATFSLAIMLMGGAIAIWKELFGRNVQSEKQE